MGLRLKQGDRELFTALAEYRMLAVSQVAALLERNNRATRRRLQALEAAGLVRSTPSGFGHGAGRPESIVSLAGRGIEVLRQEGTLDSSVPDDQVGALKPHAMEHQLLVNWFRAHLVKASRVDSRVTMRFMAPTSPFLHRDADDRPLIFDRISIGKASERPVGFIPDGVSSIAHAERDRTLLLFLEADMGTESVASPNRSARDVRQKIVNYQAYFRSGSYKRYEKTWGCTFNGFRLLFLVNGQTRFEALCRLVRQMPPSDLIWLTERVRMFEHGVAAKIWTRGGHADSAPQSILGSELSFRAPILQR